MKKHIFSEYFLNLATALAVAGFSFILYKFVLMYYGINDFDFFVVVRRYQAALLPIFLLGLGVLLPKLLAMDSISKRSLNFSILFIIIFYFLALTVSASLSKVYYYTVIFCGPIVIASVVFSIYRGKGDYFSGCISNVFFLIFLPASVFLISNNIEFFLYFYFFSSSIGFFIWILFFYKKIHINAISEFTNVKILRNGIARVPGDFLSQALYVIPVFIATKESEIYNISYLSFGLSLFLAFSIPLRPISTILLVRVVKSNDGHSDFIRKLFFYSMLSVGMTVFYLISVPYINKFYFNIEDFEALLYGLSYVVFFNAMYVLLRSYIDAKFHAPLLSYFNGIAVLVLFLLAYVGVDLIVALSFSVGLIVILIISFLVFNKSIWAK